MDKTLKNLLKEHKALTHRFVTLKATVRIELNWRSDHSYDIDRATPSWSYDEQKKMLKKYSNEVKRFCKKADAYGRKHFGYKEWFWETYVW
jgi:fructose-1-phosphate kinase PfkB-like protein